MFAVSIDNLLFLLLIAAAALLQLLSKALSKSKKGSDERPKPTTPKILPPIRRAPAESDADRIRKFLEALGQPSSATPPPPVAPRTDVPPRPLAPVQPPPVIPRAWTLHREQRTKSETARRGIPLPEQPSRAAEKFSPAAATAASFEVQKAGLPLELEQLQSVKTPVEAVATNSRLLAKEGDFKSEISTLLGSNSSLREVILLREILGPPRGLQALDLL
jgi:hypothetical protein